MSNFCLDCGDVTAPAGDIASDGLANRQLTPDVAVQYDAHTGTLLLCLGTQQTLLDAADVYALQAFLDEQYSAIIAHIEQALGLSSLVE